MANVSYRVRLEQIHSIFKRNAIRFKDLDIVGFSLFVNEEPFKRNFEPHRRLAFGGGTSRQSQ
jgi:hypothetical protein